jgi:hypothetical protein
MPFYKYFAEERFARAFMRKGEMRFGSLSYYRGLEDGGARGDSKDGTLHYAPAEGLEITMVADGRKLTGTSFSTTVENMFVYCVSGDRSPEQAEQFGAFCVEIADIDAIVSRLEARACTMSKLDYARVICGPTEYRPLNKIPGVDWAFPEKVVLIKPPEYAGQNEFRLALPLKSETSSEDTSVIVRLGSLEAITRLHCF